MRRPPIHLTNEKARILAQLPTGKTGTSRHFLAIVALVAATGLGTLGALGTMPGASEDNIPRHQVAEQLVLPPLAALSEAQQGFLREEKIQRGDTVAAILQRLGVDDHAANEFLRTDPVTQTIFWQLSPGKNIAVRTGLHGELQTLVFPLNGGNGRILAVERHGDNLTAVEQSLQAETHVVMKSAEIRYSLFGASDAAGIPDKIVMQLADIFGGDIDFHRDLRKGDRFTVIYESINFLGRPIQGGRILAAEFINDGKIHRAAWFAGSLSEKTGGGYYTAEGKNIHKAFLRSPLEFSRITSGFTLARFHPVLKKWRAHKGGDYGAPVGTGVKATGDAVIDFAGIQGSYGKVVVLRQQGHYTTLYGHLSGFAPGIRKGSRVYQGDVMGFVGATGLASGPHLHYEFRINNVHQNPLAIVLPSAPSLAPGQLAQFLDQTGRRFAQIDLIHGFNLAQAD